MLECLGSFPEAPLGTDPQDQRNGKSGSSLARHRGSLSPSKHSYLPTLQEQVAGSSFMGFQSYRRLQKGWNIGLGRFMLVFLLLKALGLGDSHILTFWLLLYPSLYYPPRFPLKWRVQGSLRRIEGELLSLGQKTYHITYRP